MINATLEYLLEYGYQSASLAQIAQTAGLTTGAVQHHFRSKRELMLAVITEELFAPLEGLDPMDQVKAPFRGSVQIRCGQHLDLVQQLAVSRRLGHHPRRSASCGTDGEHPSLAGRYREGTRCGCRKLFPEFAFTPERLKNLQHFVTSHLRGVRFMRIYEEHRLGVDEQLRLLAEALRQMVEATPRK